MSPPIWAGPLAQRAGWATADFWVRAPARVNLIGEHTDYMGGLVLPVALNLEMRALLRRRSDRSVDVRSLDLDQRDEFALGRELDSPGPGFGTYVRAVTATLAKELQLTAGFDLGLQSDIPVAAGLSSSAALEAIAALSALAASGESLSAERLVGICHRAENEIVGVACGLMDQTICIQGRSGCALAIDCDSRRIRPVDLGDLAIVVCDTRAERRLSSSEYNLRRRQCEAGLATLSQIDPSIGSLRDVTEDLIDRHAGSLPEPIGDRVRHVVSENERVRAMVTALESGRRDEMGALMAASHRSLSVRFAVSSDALDAMVDAAEASPGVIGARLTGGGFGGCTVNLVEPAATAEFAEAVASGFRQRTGREAGVHICQSADGASWGAN